ncbi:hypothetical protein GCM10027414_04940 [Humibacter ginsengiterrae]
MGEETPRSPFDRFFRACLLILGGVVCIWVALSLVGQIWGWLLLAAGIALMLWCAVLAYRYWWGSR